MTRFARRSDSVHEANLRRAGSGYEQECVHPAKLITPLSAVFPETRWILSCSRSLFLLTGQEFFDSNKGPCNCRQVKRRENRKDGNDAQHLRQTHSRFSSRLHWTQFNPHWRAISHARSVSALETVPPNSLCRAACQAGQNPERKFTLTPGNDSASHSATGRQQHST